MKKFLVLFIILIFSRSLSVASIDDYDSLYNQAQLSTVKLMHNLDPYQDEDYQKYIWSPYPLFRTCSYLYFKDLSVSPGYYLLTPRQFKGNDYVLFKTNGKVQFIVPVVKIESVPEDFYKNNFPIPKKTKFEKFCKSTGDFIYKHLKSSRRVPPPQAFVDASDEGNYFVIKLYYGDKCYVMAFRKYKY